MDKKEDPMRKALNDIMHDIGYPEFTLYDRGQPMLVTFRDNTWDNYTNVTFTDNTEVVGYYGGFNQKDTNPFALLYLTMSGRNCSAYDQKFRIKMGFISTPKGILFNMSNSLITSYIKQVKKLVEEMPQDGFLGYGCNPNNVRDIIRMIVARNSPERPIVRVSYSDVDIIGFLGENPDGAMLNLAHQRTKTGEYDTWLNPKFLDGRDCHEKGYCNITQPTLDGIISISVLSPEK